MEKMNLKKSFENNEFKEIVFSFENIYPNGYSEKIIETILIIVKSYRKLKCYKEANELCEKIINIFPSSIPLLIEFAEISMSQKKWNQAIGRWNSLLKIKYHHGAMWRLARAYLAANFFKEATACLEKISENEKYDYKIKNFQSLIDSAANKKYSIQCEYFSGNDEICLDSDFKKIKLKINDFENVNLKGWVKIPEGEDYNFFIVSDDFKKKLPVNFIRNDVFSFFKEKNVKVNRLCGFDFPVNLKKSLSIYSSNNGLNKEICKISLKSVIDVTKGKNDWIFLANDTNKSVDQYTGKVLISQEALEKWELFVDDLKSYREDLIFLVANSKEYFASQEMPFEKVVKTNLDILSEIFDKKNFNYINPLENLKKNKFSYYKTDTHWSDVGAYIAYLDCMQRFGLNGVLQGIDFYDVEVLGDLGSKLSPPQKSNKKIHSYPFDKTKIVFSSGIKGAGNVTIFENTRPMKDSSIVLFGGSSLAEGSFQKFFSYFFRRVVSINCPGSLIKEITEYENPDYLLIQTNERYILSPGQIYSSYLDFSKSRKIYPNIKTSNSEIFYENIFRNVTKAC